MILLRMLAGMLTLAILASIAPAGQPSFRVRQHGPDPSSLEMRQHLRNSRTGTSLASNWFDVTYYGLNLRLSAAPSFLEGKVTIRGICGQLSPGFLVFDLAENMQIDSVGVGGARSGFAPRVP